MPVKSSGHRSVFLAFVDFHSYQVDRLFVLRCLRWIVGASSFGCCCHLQACQHLGPLGSLPVRFDASADWRFLDSLARSWDAYKIVFYLTQSCSVSPASAFMHFLRFLLKSLHQHMHNILNSSPLKLYTAWSSHFQSSVLNWWRLPNPQSSCQNHLSSSWDIFMRPSRWYQAADWRFHAHTARRFSWLVHSGASPIWIPSSGCYSFETQ